jgi:hypothetical protein
MQGRSIIKTSDTDVIVLCIYFDKQMTNTSELWVQMGNVTLVWNEARRKCWRSAASEGVNLTRLASRPVASFTRSMMGECTRLLIIKPTVKDSLHPVHFEGNMSAEFLRDLMCSWKGKSQCKKSCVCAEQNLACRFVLVHVQLATLTDTKHTYMWVKSKNTTFCMQQNASTEYNFASSLLWRKHVSRISPWSSVFMQGEIAM